MEAEVAEVEVEVEQDSMMAQVFVVIVTFNSEGVIVDCLKSVLREKTLAIIVIDNASTDGTVELVKQKFPKCQLIQLKSNVGYGSGNNIGIQKALEGQAEYVLLLNPDTVITSQAIEQFIKAAKKRHDRGIFGPKIYLNKKMQQLWSVGGVIDANRFTAGLRGFQEQDTEKYNSEEECDFISGTCMFIPSQILKRGLRFYEPYFLYYEDVEFSVGAVRLDYPSIIVPGAKIIHSETSQEAHYLPIKQYYLARNHLLFVERNAPFRVKLREVLRFPYTISEHVHKNDSMSVKGIRDYVLRKFGPYAKTTKETRPPSQT